MNNIWSDKKYLEISINIAMLLMAINFWNYGQIFLPIICLLIFVANGFKFKVNNIYIFIILCLFSVSFFAFSYKLGLYSVIGFCLPMAYYIGSNIKNKNEETIKRLIYLLGLGMILHLLLNMFMEISFWYKDLSYMFLKPSHYDIWLYIKEKIYNTGNHWIKGRIRTTITSLYYLLLSGCIYYIYKYEKNKAIKYIGIALYILSSIYMLALGRRTTLIVFIISFLLPLIIDKKHDKKIILKVLFVLFIFVCVVVFAYIFNIFGFKDLANKFMIVQKIIKQGFNTERLTILLDNLKLYPKYLWGGQKISTITGNITHDIWGDIYDFAGIIPYILFIIYSIYVLIIIVKIIRDRKINKKYKTLFITVFVCTSIVLFVEPIMTCSSIYLTCLIVIYSTIETLNN